MKKWLLVGLLALGCGGLVLAQKTKLETRPIDTKALENVLIQTVENGAIPGAIMTVQSGQTLDYTGAMGFADILTERPLSSEFMSRMGAATMTLTAVCILQYVQDGIIRLDAKLKNLAPPEILDSLPYHNDLTIQHLLNHTSGLADYLEDQHFWDRVEADPTRNWTAQELLRYSFETNKPPKYPLGEKHQFSSANYLLLGLVLEKLGGQPWYAVIRKRILEPLDMNHTFPDNFQLFDANKLMHGYADADGNGLYEDYYDINQGNGLADCGLVSTTADMAKFMKALFLDKVLLHQEYLDLMTAGMPAPDGNRYGLGLNIIETKWGILLGHSGGMFGYTAGFFCMPKFKLCLAFLLSGSGGGAEDQFDYLLGKTLSILLD